MGKPRAGRCHMALEGEEGRAGEAMRGSEGTEEKGLLQEDDTNIPPWLRLRRK